MAIETTPVERKLDTLIVLLAKQLYGDRKVGETVLLLSDLGLSVEQIAIVAGTSGKNVANRLSEQRRNRLRNGGGDD